MVKDWKFYGKVWKDLQCEFWFFQFLPKYWIVLILILYLILFDRFRLFYFELLRVLLLLLTLLRFLFLFLLGLFLIRLVFVSTNPILLWVEWAIHFESLFLLLVQWFWFLLQLGWFWIQFIRLPTNFLVLTKVRYFFLLSDLFRFPELVPFLLHQWLLHLLYFQWVVDQAKLFLLWNYQLSLPIIEFALLFEPQLFLVKFVLLFLHHLFLIVHC